jgi:ketosteroid isomerase-like protein
MAVGFRQIDRRKLTHLDYGRDEYLKWLRGMSRMRSARFTAEVLATRGERLALTRVLWSGASGSVGPSEIEFLQVDEVDVDGSFVVNVTFDPDDLDAAHAELDERYATREAASFGAVTTGARAFAAAVAARDWDALAAVLAPDLVVYDHRPLGWETLHGPAMLVDTFKSFVELAPDVRLRIGHVTVSAGGSLAVATFSGTHEGGEFEDVRVVVHEYDGNGTICRHDIYNVDQLDEAWARFAELRKR